MTMSTEKAVMMILTGNKHENSGGGDNGTSGNDHEYSGGSNFGT